MVLNIGDVVVSDKPLVLGTILGSCVSVCLFDDRLKIGGMNHFLLPYLIQGISDPSCCGTECIRKLIHGALEIGSDIRDLKAKLFGGGRVIKDIFHEFNIGEKNIMTAKEMLGEYGIPIIREFTGAENGIKVFFHTHSGRAFLKEIKVRDYDYPPLELIKTINWGELL